MTCPSIAQPPTATFTATVSYDEPTTEANGNPLDTLEYTTMYFEVRDSGGVALEQWEVVVPANSQSGGDSIAQQVTRTVSAEADGLYVWVSATNAVGESMKAGPATKSIAIPDLGVPGMPLNLQITIENLELHIDVQ